MAMVVQHSCHSTLCTILEDIKLCFLTMLVGVSELVQLAAQSSTDQLPPNFYAEADQAGPPSRHPTDTQQDALSATPPLKLRLCISNDL